MLCALLLCQISFDKFQNSSNILFKNLEVHIHIYSKHIKGERLFCFCLLILYIFVNRRAKVTHYGQAWLTYPEWTLHTVIVTLTMINFVNGHGQMGPCGDLGGGHFGGQNITKWTRFFSVSLKVLAACLSLSPTTSSTFPAAQTFPPRLFRPLSRKGRTKDRVKSCLRESHPRCPALHYSKKRKTVFLVLIIGL